MQKGYKTTEFWLTALGSLLTLANQSGLVGAPLPTEAVMSVAGMLAAYVGSRGIAKAGKK